MCLCRAYPRSCARRPSRSMVLPSRSHEGLSRPLRPPPGPVAFCNAANRPRRRLAVARSPVRYRHIQEEPGLTREPSPNQERPRRPDQPEQGRAGRRHGPAGEPRRSGPGISRSACCGGSPASRPATPARWRPGRTARGTRRAVHVATAHPGHPEKQPQRNSAPVAPTPGPAARSRCWSVSPLPCQGGGKGGMGRRGGGRRTGGPDRRSGRGESRGADGRDRAGRASPVQDLRWRPDRDLARGGVPALLLHTGPGHHPRDYRHPERAARVHPPRRPAAVVHGVREDFDDALRVPRPTRASPCASAPRCAGSAGRRWPRPAGRRTCPGPGAGRRYGSSESVPGT
jgi:hypothetical protein